MMSHGLSFKTDLQKCTQHVLVITQMKECIVQMGIPGSCTGPSGITKESIYGVLLGQLWEKEKCLYQSGQWLWKLCFLERIEVLPGTHMELEINSSVPGCIPHQWNSKIKQNKMEKIALERKPHSVQIITNKQKIGWGNWIIFCMSVDLNCSPKLFCQDSWLGKTTLDMYWVYYEDILKSMCNTEPTATPFLIFFFSL